MKSRRNDSGGCVQRQELLAGRIREAIDGYAVSIVRLIGESYGRETVQKAWREFTIGGSGEFLERNPHSELFFAWLFHEWAPGLEKGDKIDDETLYGVQPTRAVIERSSSRLKPLVRRYLEACVTVPLGFYEILDCKPGVGFKARDVMTGMDLEVREGLASISLKDGDIVFAHIVPIEGIAIIDAVSPLSFPPIFKTLVLQLCQHRELQKPPDQALRNLYFTHFGASVFPQPAEMQ